MLLATSQGMTPQ